MPYGDINLIVVLQVDLLKNKLGFDEAFNYKEEPDLDAALKRLELKLNYKKSQSSVMYLDLSGLPYWLMTWDCIRLS